MVQGRLRLLASAVSEVKQSVKKITISRRETIDESRDSCFENTTVRQSLFLKSGSDADLFEARRRFALIPVDCGHNGKPKSDCLAILAKALNLGIAEYGQQF